MSHVFISYKHDDEIFINLLEEKLEAAGFSVWTDKELLAGDDWKQGIDDAIRGCFALIAVMTPEARASEYVTYEWSFAWGIGVKVIPLMLRKTDLHPRLAALQHLNFTGKEDKYPWSKLIDRLQKLEQRVKELGEINLIKDLESKQALVRQKAAQGLGDLRSTKAVQGLIQLLQKDRSKKVQAVVADALEKIGTDEAKAAVQAWKSP